YIAIVVLTSPYKVSVPLQCACNHIIDEAVLVCDARFGELGLEFILINFLEDVFESSVIFLEYGILRGKIKRPFLTQRHVEAAARESSDAVISIVHGHRNAIAFEVEHFESLRLAAIFRSEGHGEFAFSFNHSVSSAVLITKSVTTHNNRSGPVGDEAGNIFYYDWFAENGAVEYIPDSPIRTFPHAFEVEFLHSGFIWSDGCALDAYSVFADCIRRINCNLVAGGIAVLDAEVEIFNVEFQVR